MKLARFQVDDWESYGLVEGYRVRSIQGSIFGEYTVSQASYPLERIKLLPPTRPTTFWAVGRVGGEVSDARAPLTSVGVIEVHPPRSNP